MKEDSKVNLEDRKMLYYGVVWSILGASTILLIHNAIKIIM